MHLKFSNARTSLYYKKHFFVFLPNINAIVKGYPSDQVLYYFSLPNNPSGSVEELHKFFSEFQSRVLEKEKILQEVNQL